MNIPEAPKEQKPNGADILNRVVNTFEKYTVQAGQHEYVALSLYVAYTHASMVFDSAPRLLATSAEKRSGKTRTLEIISELCRRPLKTTNTSVAVLYRSIDLEDPITIILDEADAVFGTRVKAEQNEDLRSLINAGFERGGSVYRMGGARYSDVVEYHSFAPVVMAGIGELPDTITDRAVNIRLKRRMPHEEVSPYRFTRDSPSLHVLREEIAAWVGGNLEALAKMEPESPVKDRAADVWEPLLAIADLAGGEWPERARKAATYFTERAEEADEESSPGIELLHDIQKILAVCDADFILSRDLVSWLKQMEDTRWEDDYLTTRKLANLLSPYEVAPVNNGMARGYKRARLGNAISRWLPPPSTSDSPVIDEEDLT